MPVRAKYYYDISIPNNIYTNPAGEPYKAVFSETRDSPLFEAPPEDYNLSVVRFTVPSSGIPYQYMPTIFDPLNPLNPNRTIYSISMKYAGIVYRQDIQWVSQAGFAPAPLPPPAFGPDTRFKDDLFNYYYALYSLNHFCSLINTAFDTCFQTNIVPLLPPPGPGQAYTSPYLTFNGATELFTLWVSASFVGSTPLVELGGNYLLGSNFETSWNVVGNSIGAPDGLDFTWVLLVNDSNTRANPDDPGGFLYDFQQEFDTTGSISKFKSLLFVSPTLPCNNDIVSNASVPVIGSTFGGGNNFGSVAGSFLPLITDFEVDGSTVRNLKGSVHYVPTAEYRRLSMRGRHPISQVDISIYWSDVYGNVYPLIIPNNSTATIKILFEQE